VLNLLGAALSLPARVLDVMQRDRVAGRRASLRADRAMIEVRGLERPDASQYPQRFVQAMQELPAVAWAGVNAPLRRAIIALEPSAATTLAELVDVVDRIERDHLEKAGLGDTGPAVGAGTAAAPPTDRGRVDQALWA